MLINISYFLIELLELSMSVVEYLWFDGVFGQSFLFVYVNGKSLLFSMICSVKVNGFFDSWSLKIIFTFWRQVDRNNLTVCVLLKVGWNKILLVGFEVIWVERWYWGEISMMDAHYCNYILYYELIIIIIDLI